MWFSVCHRFSIHFLTPVDPKWVSQSICLAAMILAVVLYAATVLCPIASGLPKFPIRQSPEAVFDIVVNPLTADDYNSNRLDSNTAATSTPSKPLHPANDVTALGGTVTPKPPNVELDDIFISVKTTKANHGNRLDVISKTWFHLAAKQTWFFTDADDEDFQQRLNGHLINTKCPKGHSRRALSCKMAAELNTFLEHQKKWFCHFDDDNYVNVPQLVQLLDEYHPTKSWYLGKPSVASPLEIHLELKESAISERKIKFWFATGGAGFCISRPLAEKMSPLIRGDKLTAISDRIRFPDDVTVGFIIEYLLRVPLTVVDQFHSHFEPMSQLPKYSFRSQVSFSYGQSNDTWNVVKVDGFDRRTDPTRFHSLHCHLFPQQCGAAMR